MANPREFSQMGTMKEKIKKKIESSGKTKQEGSLGN